ncbi:MAG: hypothetical protein DDT32_01474 [Syntrophomonadaceae bacterium]|nr:hypothetical protein [Bacillota bacterium]MBT9147709.1 hypothetical protein [Bacillota bacterium]
MHPDHKMKYDSYSQRWNVYSEDNIYCRSIHCGSLIDICLQGYFLEARVEMDTDWYVIIERSKFYLNPSHSYDVA